MEKEYRVVSMNPHQRGYSVIYRELNDAVNRRIHANTLGSKDALLSPAVVQERQVGIEGDDSTWRDVAC